MCSIFEKQYNIVQSLFLCSLMKRKKKVRFSKNGTSQSSRYLLHARKKPDSTLYCIFKSIQIEVPGYKLFPIVYANKEGENLRRIICRISFIFKRLYESNMSSFLY